MQSPSFSGNISLFFRLDLTPSKRGPLTGLDLVMKRIPIHQWIWIGLGVFTFPRSRLVSGQSRVYTGLKSSTYVHCYVLIDLVIILNFSTVQ